MVIRLLLCISASIAINHAIEEKAYSQTYPDFKAIDELFDWYKVCMDSVEKNYSCMGHATISGSASDGVVAYDWFHAGLIHRANPPKYYSEVRRTFGGVEATEVWEKYLTRAGDDMYYSMGPFSNPLTLMPKPEMGPNGKLKNQVARHMVVPNMFMLAIVSNSAYTALHADKPFLLSEIEGLRVIDGKIENGLAKGFLVHNSWGLEIEFREEVGWMPTKAKGFFRDEKEKGPVDRSHFPTLHYEVETEWERINNDGGFVPKKVVNFVARKNPVSKNAQTMEATAVWVIGKTSAEMFEDEAMNAHRGLKGPLSEVKKEFFLLDKPKTKAK